MNYLGIDFGTSFSSVAVLDNDGIPETIKIATAIGANGDSYSMPSSVYVDKDGSVYVGQAADNLKSKDPQRYKREFKLNIGQLDSLRLGDRNFMPQDLCEILFSYFKKKAVERLGSIDKTVITYPANFSFYKQNLIKECVNKVGFNDVVMLDEPTAAAIYYYSKGKVKDGEKLLVYDFGGGTFDIALIERTRSGYRPITAPLGIEHCGGVQFNDVIFQEIKSWLKDKFDWDGIDLTQPESAPLRRFISELEEECIRIKCQLSATESVTCGITLPSFEYVEFTITRQRFEDLIRDRIASTCDLIKQIVANAQLTMQDIDKVLLVGGTCRIPLVEKMVAETTGLPIFRDADPELIVCLGAAIAAKGTDEIQKQLESNESLGIPELSDEVFKNAGIQEFQNYNSIRNKLVSVMDRISALVEPFDEFSIYRKAIETTGIKLKDDTFKVMVLGQFKVGKSTFINSFIGDEILPSDIVPCTAVINEIKWGESKKAVIHFKNPIPMVMSPYLAKEVREYIETYNYENVPPLEVEINDLRKFVVIPEPDKTQENAVANMMPYDRIEIYWPLDICRNGVEIIDSPGLNDNESMDKVTVEYLNKADAILFVMGCPQVGADCEMKFIDNYLTPLGHDHIMFVCNRFDIVRQRERERLIENSKRRLAHKTVFGEDGIAFVSATNALDGRMDKDDRLLMQSGIIEIEKRLSEFLTKYRGGFRLKMATDTVAENIYSIRSIIPKRLSELQQNKDDVLAKHAQAVAHFNELDSVIQGVIDKIKLEKNALMITIDNSIEMKFKQIIDQIPEWTMEAQIDTKLNLVNGMVNAVVEKYVDEIQQVIKKRVQLTTIHHMTEKVQPLLVNFLESTENEVNTAMKDLKRDLENVINDVSGFDENASQDINIDIRTNIESKLPNLLTGVKVGAGLGATGLAIAIIASPALIAPVAFAAIPATLLIASIQIIKNKKNASSNSKLGFVEEYVRKQIAADLAKGLEKSLVYSSTQISKDIMGKLNIIVNNISNSLKGEIQKARNYIDVTFKDSTMSTNEINNKRLALKKLEESMVELTKEYTDIESKIQK